MSIKPGDTYFPRASISIASFTSTFPSLTDTILSPSTITVPRGTKPCGVINFPLYILSRCFIQPVLFVSKWSISGSYVHKKHKIQGTDNKEIKSSMHHGHCTY